MKKILITATILVVSAAASQAASIWSNPITGTNPNASNPYTTGDVVVSNLSVSGIGRGAGAVGTNTNNRYNANSWNTTSLDATAYFSFTLTPDSGYHIDFASLSGNYQASASNPVTSYALRSSLDGYTANVASGSISATAAAVAFNFDLSDAAFDEVTSAITFRLYAWGNASTASSSTFSINDFAFDGIVAVPEPHEYALGMAALLGVAIFIRRRKAARMS